MHGTATIQSTSPADRPQSLNEDSVELAEFLNQGRSGNEAEQASNIDRQTLLRLISAGFSFFVAGINDGSLGVLIPWVIRDYGINTAILSSV
jgi:hypothetical protein